MKYVLQFLIIMAFSFLGELLHHFIPLPVPASIYGIVLLFLALELKVLKVSDIKETSSFLIAIMPIMFLPPAVGVLESLEMLRTSLFPFIAVTFVSTVVVMAVSGRVTQRIIRRRGGRR
ncbi:MAG: CidA/LrgA family protein [Candidatus Cryptobacteroides sp.]